MRKSFELDCISGRVMRANAINKSTIPAYVEGKHINFNESSHSPLMPDEDGIWGLIHSTYLSGDFNIKSQSQPVADSTHILLFKQKLHQRDQLITSY